MKYLTLALFFLVSLAWTVPAAADKQPPVSAPLPTPTAVTVNKGVYGAGDSNGVPIGNGAADEAPGGLNGDSSGSGSTVAQDSYKAPTVVRLHSAAPNLAMRSVLWPEPVYPKLTFVYPDGSIAQLHEPEFARSHLSVAEGEAGGQCAKSRITEVDGVEYNVLGMLQLLQDAPMRALEARMGFTQAAMLVCANNALAGEAWWIEASNRTWRLWQVKPSWELKP